MGECNDTPIAPAGQTLGVGTVLPTPAHSPSEKLSAGTRSLEVAEGLAQEALAAFVVVARRKNEYAAHASAAEAVLTALGPLAALTMQAVNGGAAGGAEGGGAGGTGARGLLEVYEAEDLVARRDPNTTVCGAARHSAGEVLRSLLVELDRLHVNASCRVRQRAPEVRDGRALITTVRRRARSLARTLDPHGMAEEAAARRLLEEGMPAAVDAADILAGPPPQSLEELRARCGIFARTRNPHHLCMHLCYFREYEPVRRLYALRLHVASATGSTAPLEGWRAVLHLEPPTALGGRGAGGAADASVSARALGWGVSFVAPSGVAFKMARDVLEAVGLDGAAAPSWPRASHGGSGVRLSRPREHDLDEETD
eukprot:gene20028-23969_t